MSPIRRLTASLVLFAVAIVPAAVSPAATPPPLRVGVSPVFPPMVYLEAGKVVGVEADFARLLGADLGRAVEFVQVDWEDQVLALTEGRTDIIMSSMSITRPREYRVAFTKPYLAIGQMALIRRTDSLKYLLGMPIKPEGTIGVKKGTTGDFLVQQEFPKARRKTYASGEEAARALVRKRIDLFISDSPLVWWLEGMNEDAGLATVPGMLSQEYLAWAVRKSDTNLLAAAEATLQRLQASGEAAAILQRWIPHLK